MKFENPLRWVPLTPRTKRPMDARFRNHSPSKAGDHLIDELKRIGAKNCIISSNLIERQRGDGFYANQRVEDPGVVIYFLLKNKPKAMFCDRWKRVEHNIWALYLCVSAIRGLERWGGSEMIDALFGGFKALPAPDDAIIPAKEYFMHYEDEHVLDKEYKQYCKSLHPDMGGNRDDFMEMKRQYESLKTRFHNY